MNTINFCENTLTTFDGSYPVFPRQVLPEWAEIASAKGFDIAARVIDRLHLALRCRKCGAVHKSRLYTLMSAQPLCPACIEHDWRANADASGLEYLERDLRHRHYAFYRASCGHELRRQVELVKRVAAGKTGVRCGICHGAVEAAEAAARGWTLVGPDPDGSPDYRLYRHEDCDHEQRIARANMQSGRFSCGGCSDAWPAAGSYIYAMAFTLATGREVVKVGFSRDPESRLDYQLRRDPGMPCEILRTVPMPTGHAAIRAEKAIHRLLRTDHPEGVVHRSAWHGQIRVKSEIYDGSLLPVIMQLLDGIEAGDPEA